MEKSSIKAKPNTKKKLIITKSEANRIKIIVTIILLLVAAISYYLIDKGTYVATVDGNRISKAEYQYFLRDQITRTEQKEGLISATAGEKEKFWMTPVDGQVPIEAIKREALEISKEYMVQRIKAKEMGLVVDQAIKSEITAGIANMKGQYTDKQFSEIIRTTYRISVDNLHRIYENMSLTEKFKAAYISKNYSPEIPTDAEVKTYYDKDKNRFDKADVRYVYLSKNDEKGEKLSQDKLDAKKEIAEKALDEIKQGGDIDKIISEYSEEKALEGQTEPVGSAANIGYVEGSELIEWIFANKPNDSEIIEMENDIFVVIIEKRTSFDDVKATVKTTIETENKEKFYSDALHTWSLESKYNIITNEQVYNSISYK